jgi:integrase
VKGRRFHRSRNVRLHASGKWVVTIGRVLSPKTGKLVDRDWYFAGSEAEAVEKANAKARQWELLCTHWDRTERPYLELLGQMLPNEPRWSSKPTPESLVESDSESLRQVRREGPVDAAELSEAYAEFSLIELIAVYESDRSPELKQQDVQNSTVSKDVSQMRQAGRFLPADIPAVQITAEQFRTAKQAMFDAGLGRRTVRNYLSAAVKLLRWAYRRHGGHGANVPPAIEDAISVRTAINTSITVHGIEDLKALLTKVRGTISQMDCLLALNCGMYPEDVGRLRRDEFDSKDGSVFWDREKQPENQFRLHHVLWPETLAAVKQRLNDGIDDSLFDDFRHHKGEPAKVNVRDLAFLDKGRPRYLMKPGGSAYDLVGRRWGRLETGVSFRNLRKSANEILCDLISHDGSNDAMLVVEEISSRFLGQKSDLLVRLYKTSGKAVYTRMNRFLRQVGDHLRVHGVFESLDS